MLQAILDELKTRRIVLLGFGREGRSTWNLLRDALPELPLAVADRNAVTLPREDPHTTLLCGPGYLDRLDAYDCLVKSPGISLLGVTLPDGMRITSQADLFLRHAGCRTIGVSGTKGKSTTTSLIHRILLAAGRHALLMGNIGVPVFDRIAEIRDDSLAVIELSSHQLEHVTASPDIAVLTNLYPEHLDHYASYGHYVQAKMNLLRFQDSDGICVFNADHRELAENVRGTATGRTVPVSLSDAGRMGIADLETRNANLAGQYNLCNALLAATACLELGADMGAVREGLEHYPGMPHRLQTVGIHHGIRFVDNSIATIPEATLQAIQALRRVDTLLVGGMDRGLDYLEFATRLADTEVRNVICMPDTGKLIHAQLTAVKASQRLYWADDMDTAVRLAYEVTGNDRICLLSPTAASYNLYKDFEEKGDAFQASVRTYGRAGNERVPEAKEKKGQSE